MAWALAGAGLRVVAYFLPWVVAEEGRLAYLKNGAPVAYLNGRAVGAPLLTIGFSLFAGGVALTALIKRDRVNPRFIRNLGIGGILGSIFNLVNVFNVVGETRNVFRNTGLGLSISVGPWAQLAGAVVIFAGGVMAVRAADRRTLQQPSANLPIPPASSTAPPMPAPPPPEVRPHHRRIGIVERAAVPLAVVAALVILGIGVLASSGVDRSGGTSASNVGPSAASAPVTNLTTGPPEGVTPADGMTSQINVMHDGNADETHLRKRISPMWTRSWSSIVGRPVTGSGLIFAGVRPKDVGGIAVVALDAATGEFAWRLPVDDVAFLGLTYDRGRLFISGSDRSLTAVDVRSGEVEWRVIVPGHQWMTAPPIAGAGRVFITGSNTLYAIDEASGTIEWSSGVPGSETVPTLFGSSVVASFDCFQIQTFDAASGSIGWNHTTGCSGGSGTAAAYHDGRLYARSGPEGLILDAGNGRQLGTFASSFTPAFDGDTGYFVEGGVLRAHDLATMDTLWSIGEEGELTSAPVVVGDTIYVASRYAELLAIDPNGNVRAKIPLVSGDLSQMTGEISLNVGSGVLIVATTRSIVGLG